MNLEQLINNELDRLYTLYRTESLQYPNPPDTTWILDKIKEYNAILTNLLKDSKYET